MRRETYFLRGAARLTALILFSAVMQGCAISHLTKGLGSSWFGSSGKEPPTPWAASVNEDRLLAAAKADGGGTADIPTTAAGCPKFAIWSQDRNLTVYESGKSGDGSSIRYRGEITKTARECEIAPGRITVKYGFAGRVLMGPSGSAGEVSLPLLVHVTSRDRLPFTTEPVKVSVTLSPDKPIGYFSLVRRLTFDLKPGTRPDDYRLYVAFDRRSSS